MCAHVHMYIHTHTHTTTTLFRTKQFKYSLRLPAYNIERSRCGHRNRKKKYPKDETRTTEETRGMPKTKKVKGDVPALHRYQCDLF